LNFFIGVFGVVVFLLIVALGFMQTNSFRGWLKEKVTETVNNEINGTLSIGSIEGTILTSLFINDISLSTKDDTLLTMSQFGLKINPVELLLGRIYVRTLFLNSPKISLLQDKNGIWSTEKLAKQTKEKEEEKIDSVKSNEKSSFPFKIFVNNISINNLSLVKKTFENQGSHKKYQIINMNDLEVDSMYFAAKVAADLNKNSFQLLIEKLSGKTNTQSFRLRNLSGAFVVKPGFAQVTKLNVLTDSSDISISAQLDSINLFAPLDLKTFKDFPVKVSAKAQPFNFDDLTSFLSATEILKGNVFFNLEANGKFGDFNINKLSAKINETELHLTGRMRKLHTPARMYIDAKIGNSSANYDDVLRLLPTLPIPKYKNLSMQNMNFVYSGEPLKFSTQGSAELEKGKFDFDVFMDLTKPAMEYNADISTQSLNVFPVVKVPTNLNSSISIVGKGTNVSDLETEFNVKIKDSFYDNFQIDSLSLQSKAEENILSIVSNGTVNKAKFNVNGLLNFTDVTYPFYNLSGRLENFNLDSFIDSLDMPSDLNFDFYANGKYLDINKTIGKFHVELDSSKIRDDILAGSKVDLQLDNKENNRTINLHSDFVDFYTEGSYKILEVIDLLVYQLSASSDMIVNGIQSINPLSDSTYSLTEYDKELSDKNVNLKFNFNFKDFSLIKTLLGNDKLDIAGQGEGTIKNDSLHFSIYSKLSLNHLVVKKGNELKFFSGIQTDFNLGKSNLPDSLTNITGDFLFIGKRLYFGSNLTNVKMKLNFKNSSLFYDVAGNLSDDLRSELKGNFKIRNDNNILRIDSLLVLFKDLKWENNGPGYLKGTRDSLIIDNMNLHYGNSSFALNGFLTNSGSNLKLDVTKINLQLLEYVLTGTATDSLHSEMNGYCKLNGNLKNPELELKLSIPWITIGKTKFGSFMCDVNYSDETLTPNIRFTALKDTAYKLFYVYGEIPINLSAKGNRPFIPIKRNINLEIKSSKFDLANLGNILPYISKQQGILQTDIHIGGDLYKPDVKGSINLKDILFRLRATNLDYRLNAQMDMNSDEFKLQNFELQNAGNSNFKGTLKGSGSIGFAENGLDKMDFMINGKLALLSPVSKRATRFIFGDLFLGSDGDWIISYADKRFYLQGNVDILDADLEYTSNKTGYSSDEGDFIYKTMIDSAHTDFNELDFQNLISSIDNEGEEEEKESPFDFKVKIRTVNDIKFTVDLAKAFNQKLVLFINGDMLVENIDNNFNTQGSLKLLDGSRLEFFKNFQATGDIRFERDLIDPYLDITASYLGDYVSSLDPFQQTKEVAVKLHLKGPLSEIGKELVLDKNKFAVYVGRKDIEANIPSAQYDASDALTFILVNKFKEDLTAANKEDIAGQTNTAGLVLGPVISSFLNSTIGGGIIQDIQISQAGQYTRLGISGKYENLRYRIGGTTEALSDISKANILIQYFFTRDLSLRLERRYPIIYSEGTDERVNEMGLRYKFEF